MYTMKKTYQFGYSSYGIQEKTPLDMHSICARHVLIVSLW